MYKRHRLSTASVEMLEDSRYEYDLCEETLLKQFEKQSVEQLGLDGKEETVCCLGALLSYLQETQRTGLERMNLIDVYSGCLLYTSLSIGLFPGSGVQFIPTNCGKRIKTYCSFCPWNSTGRSGADEIPPL